MSGTQLPLRSAPVVHMALMGSSVLVIAVFWFLRGGVPMALLPESRGLISNIAYVAAVLLLALALWIKRLIPVPQRGGNLEEWWSSSRSRILLLWVLGDTGCVVGAVLWFLTDNQLVLLSLAGIGLLVLASYRPSKLLETI